jgi:Ca2+-binding RTX toxin-like protein
MPALFESNNGGAGMTPENLIEGARFGTPRSTRRPGRSSRRQRQCRPCLDELEGRELKDGGISLVAGTVSIVGTAAQNAVFISYTDASHSVVSVTYNNTTVDFNHADVSGINFQGQSGVFDLLQNVTDIATTAQGGNGVNAFLGLSGHDTFTGGDGFNIFTVAGGNDTLVGGNGTNLFVGVGGNDSVTVGNGLNIIV